MKALISLAMLCLATLPATNEATVTVKPAVEATLVKAIRLTDFNVPVRHAYFDHINCANHFITLHPTFVHNGTERVSPDIVFTNCIL